MIYIIAVKMYRTTSFVIDYQKYKAYNVLVRFAFLPQTLMISDQIKAVRRPYQFRKLWSKKKISLYVEKPKLSDVNNSWSNWNLIFTIISLNLSTDMSELFLYQKWFQKWRNNLLDDDQWYQSSANKLNQTHQV